MQLLSPPSILSVDGSSDGNNDVSSDASSDGNNDANYDTTDWGNVWKWMNKLISLVNRVIEKGLANPVNFRRSVSKVIEELLEDVKSDYVWALDYFLFRVYESIWLGDQSLYSQPYVSFPARFCVSTNSALCLDNTNRLP